MILYHGSREIVQSPEIRIQRYNKDFYFGFYCYVQSFVEGTISREAFWALAKFKKPTHQISFHTARALSTLTFIKGVEVQDEK